MPLYQLADFFKLQFMFKEAVCSCIYTFVSSFLLYLQNRFVKCIESTFLYMNIIQIRTKQKNSTNELCGVHCVHIPSSLHHANFGQFKAKQVLF